MSNKYPKIIGIPKALESYISLTERLKIQQMNNWSRIVENMQNSIPKFDSTNISGAFSTMTAISDIIRQQSLSSSFNSAFQNSSITKLQEIIHTQNLYFERIMENETFVFTNYVSDEVSQTADELVTDLETISNFDNLETDSIPIKKTRWTEEQVWQLIGILITVVMALMQMAQSEIHHQEDMQQSERHHQEVLEQQRLQNDQSLKLEQKRIQSINKLTIGIEKLTQSLTNEIDMTTNSIELEQQNQENDNK